MGMGKEHECVLRKTKFCFVPFFATEKRSRGRDHALSNKEFYRLHDYGTHDGELADLAGLAVVVREELSCWRSIAKRQGEGSRGEGDDGEGNGAGRC